VLYKKSNIRKFTNFPIGRGTAAAALGVIENNLRSNRLYYLSIKKWSIVLTLIWSKVNSKRK